MNEIICMYITLLPVIVAGVLTMIWCKFPLFQSLVRPIDGFQTMADGQRIFGDNKTWHGLIGYVITTPLATVLWGAIHHLSPALLSRNYFYTYYPNTLSYNIFIGLLLGLAYALFELPNSFMKRRLNIAAGKTAHGFQKWFFVFFDQADSIFGCALVVWLFNDIGIGRYLSMVLLGAATHIVFNALLYKLKLRKNMF